MLNNVGANGNRDVCVAKLLDAGASASFAWAVALGGMSDDRTQALVVRGASAYVAGYFANAATFGSTNLLSKGSFDWFVTKLTDTGTAATVAWAQQAGGPDVDYALGLAVAGTNVYVCGSAEPPAAFGPISLPGTGSSIACVASFTDPTLTATRLAAGPLASSSFYPDPAHGTATVQLPAVPGAATATITLRDALGWAVRTATVALPAAGPRAVSLVGLPAGLYTVQVQAGEARATHRLVVE